MITPNEIKKKADNKYTGYLQSIVKGISFQPITITGDKRPNNDTAKFEYELTELINQSKEKKDMVIRLNIKLLKQNSTENKTYQQLLHFNWKTTI